MHMMLYLLPGLLKYGYLLLHLLASLVLATQLLFELLDVAWCLL